MPFPPNTVVHHIKFVQIATCTDAVTESVYALDSEGQVWAYGWGSKRWNPLSTLRNDSEPLATADAKSRLGQRALALAAGTSPAGILAELRDVEKQTLERVAAYVKENSGWECGPDLAAEILALKEAADG